MAVNVEAARLSLRIGDDRGGRYHFGETWNFIQDADRGFAELRALSGSRKEAIAMNGDIFPRTTGARRHLRLVPPAPAPRLAVRINILNGRSAFGRSRVFRLADHELGELIAHAGRSEARS